MEAARRDRRRKGRCGTGAALALALLVGSEGRAADTFFTDLVVGETGFVTSSAGDRFFVSGDFLSSSTRASDWYTAEAELLLQNGDTHAVSVTGADFGPDATGYVENFAWGALRLAAGESISLEDGNEEEGGALYVGALRLADGVPQVDAVTGNGLRIYYDPEDLANDYLAGDTFPLPNGGEIAPIGPPSPDADDDGIPDAEDNCPLVPNGPDAGTCTTGRAGLAGAPCQSDADCGSGGSCSLDQEDASGDGDGDACECGDASGDGLVTSSDARLVQRCAVGQIACVPLCDTTGEGTCNTTDARNVQRVAVGQIAKSSLTCAQRP